MVVYDPASKQLVARNASDENKLDLTECPYCHRPLHETGESNHANRSTSPSVAASFASPEYFRMLRHSLPGSANSSRPPSPRRQLTNPALFRRSTPTYTPQDTEFVGSSPVPPTHGISSSAFSPNYFNKFFVEERELGKGGKGVVLLVKHVLDGVSLGHFALKRIPVGDDHEWLEKVLVEVQLLQHLSHQNLVSYRHVWLEDVQLSTFGPSVPCAFVLQQFCNGGDLHEYVCGSALPTTSPEQLKQRIRRQSKGQEMPPQDLRSLRELCLEEILSFFKDITSGLNHLHINGYIHRDLKPSNCLLHRTGKGEPRVLVSDFGEVQKEDMVRRSTGATGTISYCAPEVLRREYPSGDYGNFTVKSDVFSLGMILYFLCFSNLPYRYADNLNEENEDLDQLREEITTWNGLEDQRNLRPDLPDKLYKSLRRLLSLDPENRPTAEEILHSIKTGSSLEENLILRTRPAGHLFEKIQSDCRISPVDITPSSTPMPRTQAVKKSTGFTRPGPPPKLRLESFHEELNSAGDRNKVVSSPNGSLVLRSRHSSPVKISDPPEFLPSRWQFFVLGDQSKHTLRIVFLTLKIVSIGLPCIPFAARPAIAFPLFGLATLDLLLLDFSVYISLLLMCLHTIIMLMTMRGNLLCLPQANNWEGM